MTTRLTQLRSMRDFLDREIAAEIGPRCHIAIEKAAELYDVTVNDVLGHSRKRQVTQARMGAAWLMRREGKSFRDTAAALGCDHTTVMHACQKIDREPATRALLLGLEVVA